MYYEEEFNAADWEVYAGSRAWRLNPEEREVRRSCWCIFTVESRKPSVFLSQNSFIENLVTEEMVKDVSGQILHDAVEVRRRSAQYFEQVLNVADAREANINVVGNWRMPVLGDLNERAISLEEVGKAVNEMRSGKAPGLDGFPVECLLTGT